MDLIHMTYEDYGKPFLWHIQKLKHRGTVPTAEQLVNARARIWACGVYYFIHYT